MVIFDEDVKPDLAEDAGILSKWTRLLKAYKNEFRAAMDLKDVRAKQDVIERVKLKYKKVTAANYRDPIIDLEQPFGETPAECPSTLAYVCF
jgi:hypothetical protein